MKILLAQPDSATCAILRGIFEELIDDVDVLEARGISEVTSHIVHHPDLDLLVADLQVARTVDLLWNSENAARSSTRLVVWSSSPSRQELEAADAMGAQAYLPTATPRSVTRAALQMVMAGGRYFPPDLLVGSQVSDWVAHPSVRPSLTPRQTEVLALLAVGRSNKAIARELGTTAGTVKVHVTAILKTLGVRNRTEAVMIAQRGRRRRRLDEYSRRANSEP